MLQNLADTVINKCILIISHLPYLITDLSSLAVNVIPIDLGSVDSLASLGFTSFENSFVPGKVFFKLSTSGGTNSTITPEIQDIMHNLKITFFLLITIHKFIDKNKNICIYLTIYR